MAEEGFRITYATMTADNMETLLAAQIEVPPADLQELVGRRAQAVQAYLTASGKVALATQANTDAEATADVGDDRHGPQDRRDAKRLPDAGDVVRHAPMPERGHDLPLAGSTGDAR